MKTKRLSTNEKILLAVVIVAAILGMGASGAMLTEQGLGDWYQSLALPAFTPSGQVIGIVWSLLYTCLALSAYFTLSKPMPAQTRKKLIAVYTLIVILTAAWSWIFFVAHLLLLAAIEAAVLAVAAFVAWKWSKKFTPVAHLMLLYVAWVTFATALTSVIVFMNT